MREKTTFVDAAGDAGGIVCCLHGLLLTKKKRAAHPAGVVPAGLITEGRNPRYLSDRDVGRKRCLKETEISFCSALDQKAWAQEKRLKR